MNNYNERIVSLQEDLTRELDIHELTVVINKGLGLYIEVETDLFTQSLPSLHGNINEQAIMELQSCKEKMTSLLQKIVEKEIGDRLEKLFSKYLTEELKNPRTQTMRKILYERESKELKALFVSIDNVL